MSNIYFNPSRDQQCSSYSFDHDNGRHSGLNLQQPDLINDQVKKAKSRESEINEVARQRMRNPDFAAKYFKRKKIKRENERLREYPPLQLLNDTNDHLQEDEIREMEIENAIDKIIEDERLEKEGILRLMKLHHLFAILMWEIAPWIKISMALLVHRITQDLSKYSIESESALGNIYYDQEGSLNEETLTKLLNAVVADKELWSSLGGGIQHWRKWRRKSVEKEANHEEKQLVKGTFDWIDEWCHQFYRNSYNHEYLYGYRNYHRKNPKPLPREEMLFEGWKLYVRLFSSCNSATSHAE